MLLTILPPFWPKMPPTGLGYLQSFLRINGIKAEILDLNNFFYRLCDAQLQKKWQASCNVELEENIFFLLREAFPVQYQTAIEKLLEYDVIGFSCFKSNFKFTLQIAELLKNKRKDIKIIFGGPEISRLYFKAGGRFPEQLTALGELSVAGEGELPLLEYLKADNDNNTAQFKQLADLSGLPFPIYQGLDLSGYSRKDAMPLQFSRGCVRNCAFCSERLLYKGFRLRPVDNLIEEIRYHKENNRTNYFTFFDSMINADPAGLEELCGRIIASFGRVNWEAQIAVSPATSEELLFKMKESGCYNLFVGLESACDNVLRNMRKGFTVEQALGFFKKLKSAGLSYGVSVITGYPGETEADFKDSLEFILKHKELIPKIEQVNPFVYYDGTDTDKGADYKLNKVSLRRMETFVTEIKRNNFKYTNAFLGNLIEK